MTFVPYRGRQRFGDITDFLGNSGYSNPDGTPTYDGGPYDAFDPNNPYNQASALPTVSISAIPLAWTETLAPITDATFAPAPLVNYTPGAGSNGGTVVASGLPAVVPAAQTVTSILTSLTSIFGGKSTTPVPLSPSGSALTVRPATASTTSGLSTTTLLLLAGLGIGAFVLLKKKRA